MVFIKNKEDFVCENCQLEVKGSGFTNHCPQCLYSKHVDNNPGDRLNQCRGLMRPIKIESKSGQYILIHKCLRCGEEKRNKIARNDDIQTFLNNMI